MSKYDPLRKFLLSAKHDRITTSFSEIELILGFDLPKSARKYSAWWSNASPETGQHPYSQAWLGAGMKAKVDLTGERVVFERSKS